MCDINASSDLHFKWSFGVALSAWNAIRPDEVHVFPNYCWSNLHPGSRKIGLVENGVQNISVISHFLVEDYLQCCFTYRTLVCPCQLRNGSLTQLWLFVTSYSLQNGGFWRTQWEKYALKVLQKSMWNEIFPCILWQNSSRNSKCDPTADTRMEVK